MHGAQSQPQEILDRFETLLGHPLWMLRVVRRDLVELQVREPVERLPSPLRWRHATMRPGVADRGPWECPGWLEQTVAEVEPVLAELGLTRAGAVRQCRHTSVTALLEIPTSRSSVWLKAVPPMFRHEAGVVRCLSSVAPGAVPEVLHDAGRWWLSAPFPEPADPPTENATATIARLQVASVEQLGELRRAGCPERTLEDLHCDVGRLADDGFLMPERDDELRRALPALARACEETASLGFPATIVHSDFTPFNRRWTARGWLTYDWTDATIAHPFLELATPLAFLSPREAQAAVEAFARVWSEVMPRTAVDRALSDVAVLGAAHQATNYARIVKGMTHTAGDQASIDDMTGLLRYWVRALCNSTGHAPPGDPRAEIMTFGDARFESPA